MSCDLYCCLLPQYENLRTCRSGFPIATAEDVKNLFSYNAKTEIQGWTEIKLNIFCIYLQQKLDCNRFVLQNLHPSPVHKFMQLLVHSLAQTDVLAKLLRRVPWGAVVKRGRGATGLQFRDVPFYINTHHVTEKKRTDKTVKRARQKGCRAVAQGSCLGKVQCWACKKMPNYRWAIGISAM